MSMNARAADPSMEEILASIRRIIADDLPPRREPRPALEAVSQPGHEFAVEPYGPVEIEGPPPAATMPPRRASEPSLMAAAELPVPESVRRLVDLAAVEDEVQAEVAMALRGSIANEPRPANPARPEPAAVPHPAPAATSAAAAVAPADPLRAAMSAPAPAPPVAPPPLGPAHNLPPRPTFNFGQSARPPVAAPRAAEPDRLVSAPTNAAVAASFGTLARSVTSTAGRSLEDVVAELLKPMLRSWLDDHLSTIVERLVKAEIERVSRGGR
jgi:cell pole-organizing protein PopZ